MSKEIGRNDPCPCGSGKKFKKCCEAKSTRRTLGKAEVLSGTDRMASLFNRVVLPPVHKPSEESPPDEKHLNI